MIQLDSNVFSNHIPQQRLRLDSNPLNCNCSLGWLSRLHNINLDGNCLTPDVVRRRKLKSLFNYGFGCLKPKIIEEPIDVAVELSNELQKLDEHISFRCKVEGEPKPIIIWLHNNNIISNDIRSSGYHLLDNGATLMIEKSSEIQGIYQCMAKNIAGEVKSRSAHLRFVQSRLPTSPVQTFRSEAILNFRFSLDCNSKVDSWYFNKSLITKEKTSQKRIIQHDNGTLTVQNAKLSDKGTYKCKRDKRDHRIFEVDILGK